MSEENLEKPQQENSELKSCLESGFEHIKQSNVYCQSCDIPMDVLKSGYKIESIKNIIKFECTADDNNEKIIECIAVDLCRCPECDYNGLVDLGEGWLSKKELAVAIKEKRIFSENPEINVILRLLA